MTDFLSLGEKEPNPKNPIIAAFFRNIGYADQLGSGVRNLFKYSKYYSGKEPQFIDGDVFRIIVPLDETYSYDFAKTESMNRIRNYDYETIETILDTIDIVPGTNDTIFEMADLAT